MSTEVLAASLSSGSQGGWPLSHPLVLAGPSPPMPLSPGEQWPPAVAIAGPWAPQHPMLVPLALSTPL